MPVQGEQLVRPGRDGGSGAGVQGWVALMEQGEERNVKEPRARRCQM